MQIGVFAAVVFKSAEAAEPILFLVLQGQTKQLVVKLLHLRQRGGISSVGLCPRQQNNRMLQKRPLARMPTRQNCLRLQWQGNMITPRLKG
jgi:hypothetical protein